MAGKPGFPLTRASNNPVGRITLIIQRRTRDHFRLVLDPDLPVAIPGGIDERRSRKGDPDLDVGLWQLGLERSGTCPFSPSPFKGGKAEHDADLGFRCTMRAGRISSISM